MVSRKLSEAN